MEKFYITTAIDYVNGAPHIGHALEKIQADALARYYRAKGRDVFFLTGTDEHGVKNLRAARAAGLEPEEFVYRMSEKFRSLKDVLNLSWDDFINTSDKERHWPGARLMWEKLAAAEDIYKGTYRGLYCVGHEAFVTKKDLIDGKCLDHGAEPEIIEEENYFFRLSKYSKEIGDRIKNKELKIVPESRQNEILSLIEKDGLEDVSFSRPSKDLPWGIPVPNDSSQNMYVWCDALTNYLSAIGFGRNDNWRKFWPADVHVIGKEILRFHAAIWPGMLLSAGLQLPKEIFAHGLISIEGRKMSKTIGNIVDPFDLIKKYGTDAVRYYLLREIPSHEDGDFSEEKFRERYNGDLANGLGNFASRVLTLGASLGRVQDHFALDHDTEKHIDSAKKHVYKKIEEFRFNEALSLIWDLIGFGDAYINKNAPWNIEHEGKRIKVVFDAVVILDNVAALLLPFLPETAQKITKCIQWDGDKLLVSKTEILFPRLQ